MEILTSNKDENFRYYAALAVKNIDTDYTEIESKIELICQIEKNPKIKKVLRNLIV